MTTTISVLSRQAVKQYEELMDSSAGLSEAECWERFPDLLRWVLGKVSILDFVDGESREVAPGVYLVSQSCPECGDTISVRFDND